MRLSLRLLLMSALLTGCVDRRVQGEPTPVDFESGKFEVSGLRSLDDGFVAYGSWRNEDAVSPSVVWLDNRGGVVLEKADQGIWRGDARQAVEDVFVGITSLAAFDGGILAVETTFDGTILASDTRNSIWRLDESGEVETSFALDGSLEVDEPGGVIGINQVESSFVMPRALQLDDGLRQVHVDRLEVTGDFESDVGRVDVIEDIPDDSCRAVCERGFSGFLDMTYEHRDMVYLVGTQVVSFFSDEPVLARLATDGSWDTSFGTDGFLRLSAAQFEGWRAHAAARNGDELAVLLFPPRGENYRVVVVDLENGEVERRFDVVSGLEDIHLDHIAAGPSGWWLGGFDFIAENRPNFLLAVDSDGEPRVDIGDSGRFMLNRRISLVALSAAHDGKLLAAYKKFGLTRIELVDPRSLGELGEVESDQDQNSR